jgi:hypothetical protein
MAAHDPRAQPSSYTFRFPEAVDHVRGPAGGPLVLVYGDYLCPYSRMAYRAVEEIGTASSCVRLSPFSPGRNPPPRSAGGGRL